VQGDLDLAERLWKQLDYSKVFSDFDSIVSSAEYKPRAIYQTIVKLFRERGLNVEPLKELLHEFLDEDKIRASPIDFGLVVVELNSFKRRYLRKEDIPHGELIDYIIGSATFPVFKPHYVDGKRFIDGGLVDNRPFSFLKNQDTIGQAICIDLTTARHFYIKDADQKDMEVNYIKASKLLGSPLAFDLGRINKNMALGYNDFQLYCEE
jgi:NTE family protein